MKNHRRERERKEKRKKKEAVHVMKGERRKYKRCEEGGRERKKESEKEKGDNKKGNRMNYCHRY